MKKHLLYDMLVIKASVYDQSPPLHPHNVFLVFFPEKTRKIFVCKMSTTMWQHPFGTCGGRCTIIYV